MMKLQDRVAIIFGGTSGLKDVELSSMLARKRRKWQDPAVPLM